VAAPDGTTAQIVGRPLARRLVWVDGYWYLFYYGTSHICYSSTADADATASTFGSEVDDIGLGSSIVYDLSVCTAGRYIHLCYLAGTTTVKYMRGTPSGGTITWASAVTAATSTSVRTMSICVTSDNHVVIAFTGASHSRVVRNANDTSSSSWSNDTAFPAAGGKQLSSSTGTYMWSVVVPLSSGSFYTVWVSASGTKALGRSCASDGTLGSVETVTDTNVTDYFGFSVNSWGDDVWVGWTSLATYYYIRARKRNSSGTWESSSPYLLNLWGGSGKGGDNIMPAITINRNSGDVFYFWWHTSSHHMYYMKFDYGKAAWDAVVDLGDTGAANDYGYLGSAVSDFNDYAIVYHAIGTSSPYTVGTFAISSPGGSNVGPSGGCCMFGGVGII